MCWGGGRAGEGRTPTLCHTMGRCPSIHHLVEFSHSNRPTLKENGPIHVLGTEEPSEPAPGEQGPILLPCAGHSVVIRAGWLLTKMETSPLANSSGLGAHPCSPPRSLATFPGSLCSQRASDKLLGRVLCSAAALARFKTLLFFFFFSFFF